MKTKQGFSLLELLVVMAIIGVVLAIGIVNFSSTNQRSREAKRKADIEVIRSGLEIYRSENGAYPTTGQFTVDVNGCINATTLTNGAATYVSNVPTDPKFNSSTGQCYIYTRPSTTTYNLSYLMEVSSACTGTVSGSRCVYTQP